MPPGWRKRWAGADLVIESIVEDLEEKRALFERLDAILDPRVPLCSNTSGLRITDIAARCRHKARTLTTHFWLPAHLVPLVEVVLGDGSDEAMGKAVVSELKTWKKAPVLVRRDLRASWPTGCSRPSSGRRWPL